MVKCVSTTENGILPMIEKKNSLNSTPIKDQNNMILKY